MIINQLSHPTRLFLLSVVCFCFIIACTEENAPVNTTTPQDIIPKIKPKGNENYLTQNSDYVYDQEKIRTYELIIKNGDLSNLDFDPAKEEYVEAALVFEGDTISPVGVRYKGSLGAYAGCLSGTDWSKPSGKKTCEKLSMQIKINWKDRKERFFDLNKLQFHSQNYDKSQLRERLAYWLFGQMGVPSPRSVHARLVINNRYSGLYGLTEEIDNRFAEYFYKEGKGNIYKEVWPIKDNGSVQSDEAFIEALKTNEENPNISLIKEFGQAISNTSSGNMKSLIRQYMDVNRIMSYAVVDRAIRHDDGPFHWYCANLAGTCDNHNYYWFEDQKNKKMHIIPWDMDGTFEHIIKSANQITPIVDNWGKISNNCVPFLPSPASVKQRSAACDKLTAAWVGFDEEYGILKKQFYENYIKNGKSTAQLNIWAKQIEPYIKEADTNYNFGLPDNANRKATTFSTWESSVATLKGQINAIQ